MSIVSWGYFTGKNIRLKVRYASGQAGTIVRLVTLGQIISTPRFGFTLIFIYIQGRSQNFKKGGGSPADTNNYDRFDAPIALNTREV